MPKQSSLTPLYQYFNLLALQTRKVAFMWQLQSEPAKQNFQPQPQPSPELGNAGISDGFGPCSSKTSIRNAKASSSLELNPPPSIPLILTCRSPEVRFACATNTLRTIGWNSIKLSCFPCRHYCFIDCAAFDVLFDQMCSWTSMEPFQSSTCLADSRTSTFPFLISALTENICSWLQQLQMSRPTAS